MKMKLAIAVALSHEAKLLVLDEATGGLDPIVRDEILDLFNDFTRDETHSILLSSHIVRDLEKICDSVAFIHNGRLVLCEEKDRLLDEFAIASLQKEAFRSLPHDVVLGYKESGYGVEALVRRSVAPPSLKLERTTLENIILFLVKGENEQ
jgi:ABC-2 type transport system ATP-binding protein